LSHYITANVFGFGVRAGYGALNCLPALNPSGALHMALCLHFNPPEAKPVLA